MAKVDVSKVKGALFGADSGGAKDALKRGIAAARPQKSNMTAYAAIGIAALLGLYFFSGPDIPEPDRSGLVEADGVVSQALPASVTGVTEDLMVESIADSDVSSVSIDPTADLVPAQIVPVATVPVAVVDPALAVPPAGTAAPVVPAAAAPTPDAVPSTAEVPNRLAGTSAADATLPAMFAGPAAGEAAPRPGLMMPAEMAGAAAPAAEEKPVEVSLQERADRGDADAMYQLGMSAGATDDSDGLKKRFRYLQAAASRGSVPAMREVAGLHERGEGVLASERMAYVWATLAAAFGEDMASFRERLAAKMSQDELESGQRAAAATLKGFGTAAMDKAKSYKTAMRH